MLKMTQISKSFQKGKGEINVLSEINLDLRPGELIAVQGASGCGKTTLLLIAGGLLHPDQGNVLFNQEDLYSKNSEERAIFRARNFGFVFQQYHLIPYLTVLENILIPDLAVKDKTSHHQALDLIENFGLSQRKSHTPGELSAGEKQRTALARAMMHAPDLIFADEITGNLDAQNTAIVIQALKKFTQDGGMVLFVTHDLNAAKCADRIVEIE